MSRTALPMDRCLGKRGAGGLLTPQKRNIALKEAADEEDQSARFCNRVGCNGRIKYGQNAEIGSSSNGKEVSRKSSRSGSSAKTGTKKSNVDFKRKLLSQSKFELKENGTTSSVSDNPRRTSLASPDSLMNKARGTEIGSTVVSSYVRPGTIFHHKSRLQHQSALPTSAVSSSSKASYLVPFGSQNGRRYSARNMKRNTVSDAGLESSSLESKSVGKKTKKKRSSEGESGLSRRGSKTIAASHVSPLSSGSDTTQSSSSREYSSISSSVLTQRSMAMNTRMRLSSRQNERNIGFSEIRNKGMPSSHRGQSSVRQFSASVSRSSNFSSSNGDNPSATMLVAHAEPGLYHGIAEVLLALEMIEQDEELTHEQALALEAGLFRSGLDRFDQHRDMRLDIDDMSYEELLALEERMGTVSTALSEEALSSCIMKSIHPETQPKGLRHNGDDLKCSICQEEYAIGEEIGQLIECRHKYHLTCIKQWLRLKNWCPICKGSAAPARSSSAS